MTLVQIIGFIVWLVGSVYLVWEAQKRGYQLGERAGREWATMEYNHAAQRKAEQDARQDLDQRVAALGTLGASLGLNVSSGRYWPYVLTRNILNAFALCQAWELGYTSHPDRHDSCIETPSGRCIYPEGGWAPGMGSPAPDEWIL